MAWINRSEKKSDLELARQTAKFGCESPCPEESEANCFQGWDSTLSFQREDWTNFKKRERFFFCFVLFCFVLFCFVLFCFVLFFFCDIVFFISIIIIFHFIVFVSCLAFWQGMWTTLRLLSWAGSQQPQTKIFPSSVPVYNSERSSLK